MQLMGFRLCFIVLLFGLSAMRPSWGQPAAPDPDPRNPPRVEKEKPAASAAEDRRRGANPPRVVPAILHEPAVVREAERKEPDAEDPDIKNPPR